MALSRVLESLDELPEYFHEHYAEVDGKYVLQGDGIEDVDALKSALRRERETVAKARKDLKGMQEKFAGVDLEEIETQQAELAEIREKKMIDEGKIDELVNERVKKMQLSHAKEVEELQRRNTELLTTLNQELVTNRLHQAALEAKIKAEAIPDALLLGERSFQLVDGQVVATDADGNVMYGREGQPLSMVEWLEERRGDRPHWFEASAGGGAQHMGNSVGGTRTTSTPYGEMSDLEKVAYIRDHGRQAWEDLVASHRQAG